jgi:hypothetical protein
MRRAFNGLYCFFAKNATSYAMINLSDLRPAPLGSEAAYRYLRNPIVRIPPVVIPPSPKEVW